MARVHHDHPDAQAARTAPDVHSIALSPSFFRFGLLGRLVVAAAALALIWALVQFGRS